MDLIVKDRQALMAASAILVSAVLMPGYAHADQGEHKKPGMSTAGPLPSGTAQIIGSRFLDLDGEIRRLGDEDGAGPVAIVLLDRHCPISTRYAPELNRFFEKAKQLGVDFYGVISDPASNWDDIRAFRKDYALDFPILLDPSGDIASRLQPVVTPEAFVIDRDDRMIYRGRIDNRFAAPGSMRRKITSHDLKDFIQAAADLESTKPLSTDAVGCFFSGWKDDEPIKATYHRDIAPILAANCVECHQTNGIAPFPLETYEESNRWADMLAYVTEERLMPPWRPNPDHGRFRDERFLSERQIGLFAAWAENDAAEGAVAEQSAEVVLPDGDWRMGTPDLVLTMTEPFNVPATGEDVYRYFVIPSNMTEDRTLVGLDFKPGDPAVVHHSNIFVDYSGDARKRDAEDPEPGFSVFGTGEFMSYDNTDQKGFGIGGWAPGADPYSLPQDTGMYLFGGGDIVVEIHYHLNGKATTDQSSVALYFADGETAEYVDGVLIGTQDLNIPADVPAYERHFWMDVPVGMKLLDIMPHMHYLGKQARVVATLPDGTERSLIKIDDWDLRWQNIYALREPLYLPPGSRIDAWFTYDNSDDNPDNPHVPPRPTKWGWKTDEEMAEIWMTVIPDDWEQRDDYINASYESWLRSAD